MRVPAEGTDSATLAGVYQRRFKDFVNRLIYDGDAGIIVKITATFPTVHT